MAIDFASFHHGMKLFLLLSGIGALFGVITYLICRYPSMRRAQFREWGPHPVAGLVLGSCIFISFTLGAYSSYFTRFYGLKKEKDSISLIFHLPRRTMKIPCAEIKKAYRQPDNPKGRTWELAIILMEGKVVRSIGTSKAEFDKSLLPLNGKLCDGAEISLPHF